MASLKNAYIKTDCKEVIVKLLATNQDNEKNQVYSWNLVLY